MKKILFPTDFSKDSMNAFKYALALAKNYNAEIITLHVYQLPIAGYGHHMSMMDYTPFPGTLPEMYNVVKLSNFQNYKDQVPALQAIAAEENAGHIKISNVLLEGDLVQSILDTIEKDQIDYVVMGTKGASGLEEIFMGSVTAKVMTSTKAIVLGIPSGTVFEPINKIGFTTEYTPEDRYALQQVIAIAEAFGAAVECLYVKKPDEEMDDMAVKNWQSGFSNITFHIITSKDVEDTIIDFVALHRINLLAMLHKKRSFFENLFHTSRTKQMAFHTKIPLLAINQ
jgi:nucleotide-binding universal stress UspA family protein